jgi:hypothetical protein
MAVRLSALRAGRPLHPKKIPGTHFCYRLSRSHGHSAAGRIRSTEKSNDLIGNRTCNLTTSSIVPQPTTLLGAPLCPCIKKTISIPLLIARNTRTCTPFRKPHFLVFYSLHCTSLKSMAHSFLIVSGTFPWRYSPNLGLGLPP